MCECVNCGQHARDKHHCVFRSKVKALTKCPKNIVDLCGECHYDIHHRAKSNIDIKMKLRFQNYLEESWLKNELTYEEIKDTFIINKKNTLRTNKYIIISELEPKNITRISKRRFQTDKSLYLDSLLYSASLGYSNNSYLIVKRKIAELHLEKMHKSIINDEIESKDSDIKIIFRTIMLLFSNEEYKVVIDKITNNKNILNIYLNYFGQDIIKIIGNDRQRHKTLSLRK